MRRRGVEVVARLLDGADGLALARGGLGLGVGGVRGRAQIAVDVACAGVNFIDVMARRGDPA